MRERASTREMVQLGRVLAATNQLMLIIGGKQPDVDYRLMAGGISGGSPEPGREHMATCLGLLAEQCLTHRPSSACCSGDGYRCLKFLSIFEYRNRYTES